VRFVRWRDSGMSVWLCAPSTRPDGGTFPLWRERGYKICVWRDVGAPPIEADHVLTGEWRGVYFAANRCMEWAFANDKSCLFAVFAGDDTLPDPSKGPGEIAEECNVHFQRYIPLPGLTCPMSTFGVMQPTGDRFAQGSIDRIAGSPWIGREFARRVYRGKGPFDERYTHMFGDEVLWEVARKLGVYWARPDLCHLHRHFMRESDAIDSPAIRRPIPAHLIEANSASHWTAAKSLFVRQKSGGFTEAMELLP